MDEATGMQTFLSKYLHYEIYCNFESTNLFSFS